ncbi:hypothetical protein [Nostoc sp. CALU 1950]
MSNNLQQKLSNWWNFHSDAYAFSYKSVGISLDKKAIAQQNHLIL